MEHTKWSGAFKERSEMDKKFENVLQDRPRCWLMKSEPGNYSIDDLQKEKSCLWDGVRNYQARNFMMRDMQKGDDVLFYHSNTKEPAIVGLARVASTCAKPDPTQFDSQSQYFDPKATLEKPIWYCVKVQFRKKLKKAITLSTLKARKDLKTLWVIKKGMRLSIQPVTKKEFQVLLKIMSD